jgi:hypothetical protein
LFGGVSAFNKLSVQGFLEKEEGLLLGLRKMNLESFLSDWWASERNSIEGIDLSFFAEIQEFPFKFANVGVEDWAFFCESESG